MKVHHGADFASASLPWTEHFTGTAWTDLFLQEPMAPVGGDLSIASVTFTPGVRTHWHRHEGGQILLVVAGQGWVGSREDGRHTVVVGDVVWTPPGEDHWHGATETTTLTHLGVTLGSTHWYAEAVDPLT